MDPDGTRVVRNNPEYIRMAIDRSLKRLQTDYVDLWYWSVFRLCFQRDFGLISISHRLNGEVPIETIVRTMAEAVKYVVHSAT